MPPANTIIIFKEQEGSDVHVDITLANQFNPSNYEGFDIPHILGEEPLTAVTLLKRMNVTDFQLHIQKEVSPLLIGRLITYAMNEGMSCFINRD